MRLLAIGIRSSSPAWVRDPGKYFYKREYENKEEIDMAKKYICYETEQSMTKEEWRSYYIHSGKIDKTEYKDFFEWWTDMRKSGVLEEDEDGVTELDNTEHSKNHVEDKPVHEEKKELSESRQKVINRLCKLVYWFADQMLKYEDMEIQEKEEFERQSKEEPDKQIFMISTSGNNARAMKLCMREVRDAVEFLMDRENDIEEWQIAGINAMCNQCNAEKIIPYDLPTAIKGSLCMHIA